MIFTMEKLTTISVTVEQREALRRIADRDGVGMRELVDRFLRNERRRQIGLMLAATNMKRSDDEAAFEVAVVASGARTIADALR
jgi:hypothetical protein